MSDDIRKGQDSSDAHEGSSASPAENNGANLSRRKFAKASVMAAPVIMTLASRPALGAYQCTVSGAISGNLSNVDDSAICASKSPGWWMNNADSNWTAAGFNRTDLFHSIFTNTTNIHNYGASVTLQQVMELTGGDDPQQVGFHAVGALLNAGFFGDAFGFTPYQIAYAWNNYSGDIYSFKHDLEILSHRWDGPVGGVEDLILDWAGIPTSP